MFEIPLNKFEKRDLVIKLHKEGKTYRDIAHIAHVSVRDIKPILKKYEQKLETGKGEKNKQDNQKSKKPSISNRAFILFRKGKKTSEVKILLDLPFKKAKKLWAQFLSFEKMSECYDLYTEYRYDIPTLLSIVTFIKRNNISG